MGEVGGGTFNYQLQLIKCVFIVPWIILNLRMKHSKFTLRIDEHVCLRSGQSDRRLRLFTFKMSRNLLHFITQFNVHRLQANRNGASAQVVESTLATSQILRTNQTSAKLSIS